jgi:hypothetical protein
MGATATWYGIAAFGSVDDTYYALYGSTGTAAITLI